MTLNGEQRMAEIKARSDLDGRDIPEHTAAADRRWLLEQLAEARERIDKLETGLDKVLGFLEMGLNVRGDGITDIDISMSDTELRMTKRVVDWGRTLLSGAPVSASIAQHRSVKEKGE
jgi:hypothetical protein